MTTLMKQLKQALREDGFKYDRWSVCMSAWFQCAAHLYEVGDCPNAWQYKPGISGNSIDSEDSLTWFFTDKTEEQLTAIGNYLDRLSAFLRLSGHSY